MREGKKVTLAIIKLLDQYTFKLKCGQKRLESCKLRLPVLKYFCGSSSSIQWGGVCLEYGSSGAVGRHLDPSYLIVAQSGLTIDRG